MALIASAAGCVQSPADDGPAPQCTVDADCEVALGEVCEQGICYGGPPDGVTFAAVIAPPEDRSDLTLTEIPELPIAQDGTIDVLQFSDSILVTGRVLLACVTDGVPEGCGEASSIGARITFERDSRIPGAPGFKRSVQAQSSVGPTDEPAFQVRLPRLEDGERYQVTIVPDANQTQELPTAVDDPAAVAPPARVTLDAASPISGVSLYVGDPAALKQITGRVRTEFSDADEGVAGMQVYARGRWTADGALVRASNLVTTGADGRFTLLVPLAMEDDFDVVAVPLGDSSLPTMERVAVHVPDPDLATLAAPLELSDMVVPPAPNPAPYVLTVAGVDGSGEESRVDQAQVIMTTVLAPAAGDSESIATYSAHGTTGSDGTVELLLYPGGSDAETRHYDLQVLPAEGSRSSTVYSMPVEVASVPPSGRGYLQKVLLSARAPLSGTILANDGGALDETSVTATAERTFHDSLATADQNLLDSLARPTALTDGDGGFVIWVDPRVSTTPAVYDLEIVPPAHADAPRWTIDVVDIGTTSSGPLALGTLRLPRAAWAHGLVTSAGVPVPGAEVRIYEYRKLPADCADADPADTSDACAPSARLRGIWHSESDGQVSVVLPDAEGSTR